MINYLLLDFPFLFFFFLTTSKSSYRMFMKKCKDVTFSNAQRNGVRNIFECYIDRLFLGHPGKYVICWIHLPLRTSLGVGIRRRRSRLVHQHFHNPGIVPLKSWRDRSLHTTFTVPWSSAE